MSLSSEEWERVRRLPLGEKVETIVDRSLDVFQQVGRIEAAALRAERAADRCEAILKRAFPSSPPPSSHAQTTHRLQSIAEIRPDDGDTLVNYKAEIAPVVAAFRFWSTLKSLIIGVLAAIAAGATVYAAFFKK